MSKASKGAVRPAGGPATTQAPALATADVGALNTAQAAALVTDQTPALTTEEIKALAPEDLAAMSTDQIAALVAPEPASVAPTAPVVAPVVMPGHTSVMYIGKRPEYTDGVYGTRLRFHRGGSHWVADAVAKKMLKHLDVYAPGEAPTTPAVKTPATQHQKEDEDTQDLRDSIANMDKDSLFKFAKIHYGQDINARMSLAEVRQQVTMLVDQYGIG